MCGVSVQGFDILDTKLRGKKQLNIYFAKVS